jgi:hypothetical protein
MKDLQTTTTGSLFNHTGILTHAGDYAGKYQFEAIELLQSVSEEKQILTIEDAWADIMFNERTNQLYAVWANGPLTSFNSIAEYVELNRNDCLMATEDAEEKISN